MLSKVEKEKKEELKEILRKKLSKHKINRKLLEDYCKYTEDLDFVIFRYIKPLDCLYITNLKIKDILKIYKIMDDRTLNNYFVKEVGE